MKAEFVNEKIFKQHQEPYKALDIGLKTMASVKSGDIIKSKIDFSVKKINGEIGPDYVLGDHYPADTYFWAYNVIMSNPIGMHLERAGSLEHAKELQNGTAIVQLSNGKSPSNFHTWGTLDKWEWYFEPLQRSQY
jgi:hypothetical protein